MRRTNVKREERILKLRKKGLTYREIALIVEINVAAVYRIVKKHGLAYP